MRFFILSISLLLGLQTLQAQMSRLTEDVEWKVTAQGSAGGGDNAPFWFTSNRFGLGPSTNYSGLSRVSLERKVENDSLRFWGVGYGVDIAGAYGKHVNRFVIQQAYLDVQWKMLRLSVGQKERYSELKNPELSTGGLTLGMNARPIPQVRFEMPEFWAIPGTKNWFAFKAHIAYGMYTDDKWQENFNAGTQNLYSSKSKFHSKALFIRIGNTAKFPLTFTGGLEMVCQFAGIGHNQHMYNSTEIVKEVPLGGNVWTAFFPGGSDVNDGFANASGNHIGSWHVRLDWRAKKWSVGAYMEHLFEDHSQMFMQYGFWKDMLLGLEINLPRNRYVSTVVYEHNYTRDQTGPILHDATPECPEQISALDDYYNHHNYGVWQHAGYVMGNPTILSPLYNSFFGHLGSLSTFHNRINMHHIGLAGQPTDQFSWRALYSHESSLGTYERPTLDPLSANFLLLEAKYQFRAGIGLVLSYGHNDGNLLGVSNAAMLTVSYQRIFKKSR